MSLFFELHCDLPREGPGDDASTERALAVVAPELPARPEIVDVGCGPGAQSVVLARRTSGRVHAVDIHVPFLDETRRRALAAGVDHRVVAVHARMEALPFAVSSIDLIWSEGAIWIVGFERGLTLWRPLLKAGGCAVVSELCWLTDSPEPEEWGFWSKAYPAMRSRAANREVIVRAGYEPICDFVLPHDSWLTEYLEPLDRRAADLARKYVGDSLACEWLAGQRREVDIARRYRGFGYVFYAMRKTGDDALRRTETKG